MFYILNLDIKLDMAAMCTLNYYNKFNYIYIKLF